MLQLFSALLVAFFFATNMTLNIILWIAVIVILVLLIMRRRARKTREMKAR